MIVLIAPLDWGLGHATRCIPLIRALERAGHTVVACASGAGARLLRAEFPHLTVEDVPGHAMTYTKNRALLPLWLLAQLPLFLLGAWREGRAARRLCRRHGAGLIIADGRYGFRAPEVPAVFVTHQLGIVPPGPVWVRAALAPLLRRLNARALTRFAEVWVPDFDGSPNLSGALGHPAPRTHTGPGTSRGSGRPGASGLRVSYIRPLCRFRPVEAPWGSAPVPRPLAPRAEADLPVPPRAGPPAPGAVPAAPTIDILALVSGPEPQRSLFEKALRSALAALPGTHVLVRGVPGPAGGAGQDSGTGAGSCVVRQGTLTVFDHVSGAQLAVWLEAAGHVVCRSGYTTMMELAGVAKANVLLVPTPGQPEQEVLAVHARRMGFAAWQDQDALDVAAGLREAASLPGFGALTGGREDGEAAGGAGGPPEVPQQARGGGDDEGEGAFTLAAWIAAHPLLTGR